MSGAAAPGGQAGGGGARWSRPAAAALLLPLAVAVAGYAPALRGPFQLDDVDGIAESRAVKDFGAFVAGARPAELLLLQRPLTTLSFAADYAVHRLDTFGYHLLNLALHLAASLLAGLLALRVARLSGAPRPGRIALGTGGLFAVHPIQTEAVAYLSQRSEVLSSALYAASLLLLLSRDPGTRPRPWGRWASALLLFLLAFAAKPIAVTLPLAWLATLLAAAPPPRGEPPAWRRALPALAGAAALAGALSLALLAALRGRPDAGPSVPGTTPWLYLLTEMRALLLYLRLLLWPRGQSVEWELPRSPGLSDPATLAAAVAVAALLGLAAFLLVRGQRAGAAGAPARLAGLGLAWFFVLLLPTSSAVPLADPVAEHRVYLASWGILLAVVAAGDALAARLSAPRVAATAWVAALGALGLLLQARAGVWASREALWRDAVAQAPGSARARLALGSALAEQGRPAEAVEQYRAALDRAGGHRGNRAKILLDLGLAQLDAGRPAEARRSLDEAAALAPDDPLLLVNRAALAGGSGDLATAEALARRVLELDPGQPGAWVLLGNLGLERGDLAGAISAYDRALALDPDRGEAHYGRALAFRALGRLPEECAALRAALSSTLQRGLRAAVAAEVQGSCR